MSQRPISLVLLGKGDKPLHKGFIPLEPLVASSTGNTYYAFLSPKKDGSKWHNRRGGQAITPLAKELPVAALVDGIRVDLVPGFTTGQDDKGVVHEARISPKVAGTVKAVLPALEVEKQVHVTVSAPKSGGKWQLNAVVNGISGGGGGKVLDLDDLIVVGDSVL